MYFPLSGKGALIFKAHTYDFDIILDGRDFRGLQPVFILGSRDHGGLPQVGWVRVAAKR